MWSIYTYTQRNSLINIITCVSGLLDGLTIILHLLNYSYGFIQRNFVQLNVYETKSRINVNLLLTTRIYIVLWMFSIIIVSIFTATEQKTLTFSIQYPNESQFNFLHHQYSFKWEFDYIKRYRKILIYLYFFRFYYWMFN
jgi:hypothetical protein